MDHQQAQKIANLGQLIKYLAAASIDLKLGPLLDLRLIVHIAAHAPIIFCSGPTGLRRRGKNTNKPRNRSGKFVLEVSVEAIRTALRINGACRKERPSTKERYAELAATKTPRSIPGRS